MKQYIRIELNDNDLLDNIIKKSYFDKGNNGKIDGCDNHIILPKTNERYEDFVGLDNSVVKIENDELIDGILRCLVKEESGDIKLYPVSIYCIVQHKKYSFY